MKFNANTLFSIHLSIIWAFSGVILSYLSMDIQAAEDEARGPVFFSMDIEPGRWEALELKNLPADIEVSVEITSAGSITAVFVNSADLERFPAVENPLFIGAVKDTLKFSVTTQEPDFYYIVMYNNSEKTSREIKLVVRAKQSTTTESTTSPVRLL